ncbi:MAG TPA: efflux RND transporter periplasmic adaptor subunit [Planctomycetota bacterium]
MRVTWIFVLALAAGCKKAEPPASMERPPAPVRVAAAAAVDVPLYLDEIGTCAARESVVIRPQVTGRLTEVHFSDGADVKAGDPLFSIDPRPFQAFVDAAQAGQAEAKAAAALARVELKRVETLVEKAAAARQELDAAKNTVEVSAARELRAAADLATARLNLEYASIKAPFPGRAGRRLVDAGNTVLANDTELLVIQRIDPLYVEVHVNEAEVADVRRRAPPLKVEVRVPGDAGEFLPGELTFIDSAVRAETGTVLLRAAVPNAERRLWPGLFTRVRLVLETIPAAVLISADAPQMSAKGTFVYVVKDDLTAEFRPVTLGQKHGDRVRVEKGVAAGEKVVVAGHIGIMPGGKVKIQEPAPVSAGAPR